MILVITGTAPYNFNRFLGAIDKISQELDEEIIMQIGRTNFKPKNIKKFFNFTSEMEMEELYARSRIVISHAGIGTIMNCIIRNKKFIIVPRLSSCNEHFDNHQMEIAREMEKKGILVVYDVSNLKDAIKRIDRAPIVRSKSSDLLIKLRDYLDQI